MKFAILGSGSKGNAAIVQSGDKYIMVDAGFSGKEINKRMEPLDLTYADMSAILVTHEHTDHLMGVGVIARKTGTPVYIHEKSHKRDLYNTDGTEKKAPKLKGIEPNHIVEDQTFEVGDLSITPFTSYHDAKKTLGYRFVEGESVFIYLTDCGFISNKIKEYCMDATSLALEFNYTHKNVLDSERDYRNKYRTLDKWGHLDNVEAAKFINWLKGREDCRLSKVFGMHLSEHHNSDDEVRQALEDHNKRDGIMFISAMRGEPTYYEIGDDKKYWFNV